ncbi:hypothetical protein C4K03_1288 [Pseudomonas synxantha]|uniref:Uncharacterized protein n=1 Tax=Pseudomonas synxantha TaxID=47883 RepID=A0A3G7U4G6_9PSED|nr:hypothetical protein C4K03_1288 [Pseudomonas synxantha]
MNRYLIIATAATGTLVVLAVNLYLQHGMPLCS